MYTAQRKTTGCWTCRLRRKKCDEGGPPCANCDSRGVFCHGYGPKPQWKDRGEKEKEEASRLKLQFRKRSARSTTRHSMSSQESCEFNNSHDFPTLNGHSPLQTDFTLPLISTSQGKESLGALDNLELGEAAWDSVTFSNDLWSASNTAGDLSIFTDVLAPSEVQAEDALSFPSVDETRYSKSKSSSPVGEREIELTMLYLGECFSLQHPSYRNSSSIQRSWILFLLVHSRTFYYASLGISAYYNYLTISGDNEAREIAYKDYQKYRGDALRAFHKNLESNWLSASSSGTMLLGECVICGIQLALLEAAGKNMQDCDSFLNTAAQSLLNNDDLMQTHDISTRERRYSTSQQLMTPNATPTDKAAQNLRMERKALVFFRTLLVWNDILSCSTQTNVPSGAEAYRKLLEDENSDQPFREITGVESWILLLLIDATLLENWKREQDAQGNLSVRELVSRAEKIESVLEQKIAQLSITIETSNLLSSDLIPQNHVDHHLQTIIFAYSILIYIHTIVSGPSPGVPEIHKSLERAISAWKLKPRSIDLKTLAWPYCVAASLATGPERDIFRDLISHASSRESTLSSLLTIKTVVEECWRSFDRRVLDRDISCDWKEVLQRLNLRILFA